MIYIHLRDRQEHGEKCTERRCDPKCGFERLSEWLAAPLTVAEVRAEQVTNERAAALLRGEIPGVGGGARS